MARARRGARRGEPNKMSVGGGCSTSGDQSARTWLLIELTQFTWSRIMTRSWLARWGMTETEVGVTISHNGDHTLNCGRLKEQSKQCLITKPVRSLPRTSAGYNCRVSNDNPLNSSPVYCWKHSQPPWTLLSLLWSGLERRNFIIILQLISSVSPVSSLLSVWGWGCYCLWWTSQPPVSN